MLADPLGFVINGDAIEIGPDTDAGRQAELFKTPEESTLRGIVHGADPRGLDGSKSLADNAYAG